MHHELSKQIIEILQKRGFETRFAGGCVRDRLLGSAPKDIDLATTALPEQVIEIFKKTNYFSVIPTGLQHGTVTINRTHESVEITTLRIDKNCDGRHADVTFTDSFKEDAARRDFTINAMYEDLDGNIYDYFGGQEDLEGNILRFVGNPEERIKEDYLRIMRYFRFLTRFTMNTSQIALDAIVKHKEGLRQISQERITSELMKILDYRYSYFETIYLMSKLGITDIVLPEISTKIKSSVCDLTSVCRLATLVGFIGKEKAEKLGQRLKLPSLETRQLMFLCTVPELGLEPADSLDLIDMCSKLDLDVDYYSDFWSLFEETKHIPSQLSIHNRSHGYARTEAIPIRSEKIMEFTHIKPSKLFGDLLKLLKRSYRNGIWTTEEEGLELVQIMTYDKNQLSDILIDPIQVKRDLAKLRMEQLDGK